MNSATQKRGYALSAQFEERHDYRVFPRQRSYHDRQVGLGETMDRGVQLWVPRPVANLIGWLVS